MQRSGWVLVLVSGLGACASSGQVEGDPPAAGAAGASGEAGAAGEAGQAGGGGEAGASGEGGAAGVGGAGSGGAGGQGGGGGAGRCQVTETSVFCEHQVTKLIAGLSARDVYWQTPATPPPAGGYPAVLLFQGSLGGPALTWGLLEPGAPFGGFQQGRLQALLLEKGFTVIAPEAAAGVAWQTNSGVPFDLTADKQVMDVLLQAIKDGQYGPVDLKRMYATGISSGGYMTSRMAVSYAGVFRALAIQSGSYATCLGAACLIPALPSDHPPTLFLHGQLDATVPQYTAQQYHDALAAQGTTVRMVVDPLAAHEWLKQSPEEVVGWFEKN